MLAYWMCVHVMQHALYCLQRGSTAVLQMMSCTWLCWGPRVVGYHHRRCLVHMHPSSVRHPALPRPAPPCRRLTDNKLNGALPDQWSHLASLQVLRLDRNGLQGTLPAAWSTLSALRELGLGSNALSGEVPASWLGSMTNLRQVEWQRHGIQHPSIQSYIISRALYVLTR